MSYLPRSAWSTRSLQSSGIFAFHVANLDENFHRRRTTENVDLLYSNFKSDSFELQIFEDFIEKRIHFANT